jgi:hypothetical protein
MALKKKLTTEAYAALSDTHKLLYKNINDEYLLDIEGDEDVGALKRAKDRLKVEAKEAKERAALLEAKLADIDGNNARKTGDIAALEKAWTDKHTKELGERDAKLSARDKYLAKLLIDGIADNIAREVSIAPELMLPHIKARLSANLDGDEPTTVVLDSTGALSKATIADLKKEIMGDKRFASVLIGSKASGSTSATGPTVTTQTTSSGSSEKVDLGKLSAKELGMRFRPATDSQ